MAQIPTSMHGSKEGHTGYVYQRNGMTKPQIHSYVAKATCDPVFKDAYQHVQAGLETLSQIVDETVEKNWGASRGRSMTRSAAKKHGVILSKE